VALAVAAGAALAAGGAARAAPASPPPATTAPCPPSSAGPNAVAPASPLFCLEADPGNRQVTLSWRLTGLTRGSTGFFVYYQANNAKLATPFGAVASSGAVAVVPGLTNGTTYTFWIADAKSADVQSNVLQAVPVTTPDAPTGLSAVPGNGQVTLTWTTPVSDGGTAVTGYRVSISPQGGPETSTDIPITTSDTLTGLTNGTTYNFTVAAVNAAGLSAPSIAAGAVPVTTPDAPTRLKAVPGNGQVTLTWAAPASTGGAAISGYHISWGTGPQTSVDVSATTRYTVPSLTNGIRYDFTVIAVTPVGSSPPSNVARAIPAAVPDPPADLTAAAGNAQVTLTWIAPAAAGGATVIGYDLYVGTAADIGGSHPLARIAGTAVTVAGLANGTRYYFTVVAVNRIGPSGPEQTLAVPITVPGTPIRLTAAVASGQAALTWAAPASTGGARVTGYLIYEGTSPGGESGPPVGGQPVAATHATVPGLTSGTTYYFTVVAVNAAGLSRPSNEASATVPARPPPSVPPTTTPPIRTSSSASPRAQLNPAPTGLTAKGGDGQATLSWAAPQPEPSGASVIGYEIYQANAPGAPMTPIGTAPGIDFTVPGLSNGTTYYFTVAALGPSGQQSAQSIEASARPQHLQRQVPVPAGIPEQLIALIAAAGAAVVGVGLTMFTRWWHRHRPGQNGQQPVPVPHVQAVPGTTRPDLVSVRNTGPEPVHTLRFESDPGVTTTTITKGEP
jgi:predicted phage tail protein